MERLPIAYADNNYVSFLCGKAVEQHYPLPVHGVSASLEVLGTRRNPVPPNLESGLWPNWNLHKFLSMTAPARTSLRLSAGALDARAQRCRPSVRSPRVSIRGRSLIPHWLVPVARGVVRLPRLFADAGQHEDGKHALRDPYLFAHEIECAAQGLLRDRLKFRDLQLMSRRPV